MRGLDDMAKLPAFQFYPGDWLKDPDLKRCSIFARGLLMDLLCLMWEAKHRGRLAAADGVTPWSNEEVVNAVCGSTTEEKLVGLKELEDKEVLSRDGNECLFSRRMIRDEELRAVRAQSGSKGGSKTQAKRQAPPVANTQANAKAKSGSSSSSSISSSPSVIAPLPPESDEHLDVQLETAIKPFINGQFIPLMVQSRIREAIALTSREIMLAALLAGAKETPRPTLTNLIARVKTAEGGKGFKAGRQARLPGDDDYSFTTIGGGK